MFSIATGMPSHYSTPRGDPSFSLLNSSSTTNEQTVKMASAGARRARPARLVDVVSV